MWRTLIAQVRNVATLKIKVIITIIFAFLIGVMYVNHGGVAEPSVHNQETISSLTGLLFVTVLNQAFNAANAVYATFPSEKLIVNRY